MARRWPKRRLKRVDLPTLGRPTMATIGSTRVALRADRRVEPDLNRDAEPLLQVAAGAVVQKDFALFEAVRRKKHAIGGAVPDERALDVGADEKAAHRDGIAEVVVRHHAERGFDAAGRALGQETPKGGRRARSGHDGHALPRSVPRADLLLAVHPLVDRRPKHPDSVFQLRKSLVGTGRRHRLPGEDVHLVRGEYDAALPALPEGRLVAMDDLERRPRVRGREGPKVRQAGAV